jgi:L,D-transpeptidase catalytic domain
MKLSYLVVSVASAAMLFSCAQIKRDPSGEDQSEVANRDAAANPKKEDFGLRVNLTTNIATFYERGRAVRRWKVASARRDGRSSTPEGHFRFHEMTVCVPWKSTRGAASTGPCSPRNPLGARALWFVNGEYGLHGVDAAHILSVTDATAESRRQSSGCVRNHPNDIKWLTNRVAALYGTSQGQLDLLERKGQFQSFKPIAEGLALEIGRWSHDDPVVSDATVSRENASMAESSCIEENANSMLTAADPLPVTDSNGEEIRKTKPYEIVCRTDVRQDGKVLLFFPVEPSGFGWVDQKILSNQCTRIEKWRSLFACWKAGQKGKCLPLCN